MSVARIVPSGGSADGKPTKIAATATAGTLFHTTVAAPVLSEIWLWLTNTSASDVIVTVEFGAATAPDCNVKFTVPASDTILAIPGITLAGSLTVKAFAATANVINMAGHINQIS